MQDAPQFETLVLSPADAQHAGLAIAAARADGVGILDLEFARDLPQVQRNFVELLAATARLAAKPCIGLRVSTAQLQLAQSLLSKAPGRALRIVVHGQAQSLVSLAKTLRGPGVHTVLAEISSAADARSLASHVDGFVAKGHEAGAWVGEDTSYILVQKLLAASDLPLFVRGGIGCHSAASCVLLGAAGVVLDDQVLLLEESPLSESQQRQLTRLNGAETRLFGEPIDLPCRVYAAPRAPALGQAEDISRAVEAGRMPQADWTTQLRELVGWGSEQLWPIGQGIGVAALYRSRYGKLGKLLQAFQAQLERARVQLRAENPLAMDAPLAQSHGTRYPIAQGPMTRVSDSAAFADAVAAGGALPFLALALMRGEQVDELLAQTATQLGKKPWGVGLLGFVPQALREEQCAAVFKHQPDYALIAGGRPDQAAQFEARGIPAYLHAPAPELLKLYLEQGARRFVFEGRECGGHIGPIASFPLWEQMIEVLLEQVSEQDAAQIHVLFAGGISDARSGAMIAGLSASLSARGMKVGVLMGTAYLFTQEIVSSGAIVNGFQQEALACTGTRSLETGPGHSTRCASTEFAREFARQRQQLLKAGKSAEEIRDQLEDLNMGRLRVASKGRDRDERGSLVELDEQLQKSRGMYMIGQVATLRDQVLTVEDLHRQVTLDAAAMLAPSITASVVAKENSAAPCDIAIIGIGMILPQIDDAEGFWGKVLHQETTITEVPRSRWDEALYFDADKSARDKVYSKWGGFLDEIVFDPVSYGIAPNSMKSIDPMQLLSLEATARALRDAKLGDNFDREHTSIILGAGGGIGDLGLQLGVRAELPRFVENPDSAAFDRLPEWTNESFAGVLLNVAAGRVANRMDFGGVNFTVDAACGSSLAAITLATQELETGRSNIAIAGGVDTVQGPFGYLCFSKTQALSPNGKAKTFDQKADGIVISEGVCVVVMKRLADAERDGDKIYAVIKAAAGSSDGKALGLTAPLPRGQMRALDRAYRKAGFSPATLGMVEAHGTGTPVGDRAEAQTITDTLIEAGAAPRSVALGSVKTLVGHTKCAAGVTGLVKTALALHHRVLPAHAGVEQPIDVIANEKAPVYLLKQPRPWLRTAGLPRRAGVSAFGFGGTNFHAVLEEYRVGWGADAPVGANAWPTELCVLRARDRAGLTTQVRALANALVGARAVPLVDLANSLAQAAATVRNAKACLALVATRPADLAQQLNQVLEHLQGDAALPSGIELNLTVPELAPKTAVLFPGQGSQHIGMGRDAALYLPALRQAVELADAALTPLLGSRVSDLMWPTSAFDLKTEAAQRAALTQTQHAQPALGAISLGYWRWFSQLGLDVQAVAGHSYGEYTALMAAGILDAEDFLRLSARRGLAMAQAAQAAPAGTMAAVMAPRAVVEGHLQALENVAVANHNTPTQTVITGSVAAVDKALQVFDAAGISAQKLSVAGAFHSPLMVAAQELLTQAIDEAKFAPPQCVVYANSSAQPYPDDAQSHLKHHLLSAVEFVGQVERMHADGVELFLELGPKSVLSGMVEKILPDAGKNTLAVGSGDGDLASALRVCASLLVRGVALDLNALFTGRACAPVSPQNLAAWLQPQPLSRTAWMVAGGYARAASNPIRSNGKREALDHADQLKAASATASQGATRGVEMKSEDQPVTAPMRPVVVPEARDASAPQGAPRAGAMDSQALLAYQETMRQFLRLQESVMAQYLGQPSNQQAPAMRTLPQPVVAPAVVERPITAPVAATPVQMPAVAVTQPVQAEAPINKPVTVASVNVDVQQVLLGIVAERTGYPEDMLDLLADMEADLGIDSIKRVEIVGALQKALPAAIAQAMAADMETYTRAKNLRTLIERVSALQTTDTVQSVAAPVVVAAGPSHAALDIPAVLLEIVAERTGYPQDMLDLAADMEADLGIDSIKRVEIVGALQKALPAEMAQAMAADMETYTRAKTLAGLIERVAALQDAPTPQPAIVANPPAEIASSGVAEPLATEHALHSVVPRYIIRPRQAPLPTERKVPKGVVIVVDGPESIRLSLVERLAAMGASPVELLMDDPRALKNELQVALKSYGPVQAILHLGGLEEHGEDSLESWRKAGGATVGKLFTLLKALANYDADACETMHVIAATRLGGTLGREAEGEGHALAGGAAGIINCYRQEYPQAAARVVDFDGQTDAVIAEHLLNELCHEDPYREIGYIGDTRYTVSTLADPLREHAFAAHLEPQADWVVLATGGARGITAEILLEMARPGLRLVLLGRTSLPMPEQLHPEHETLMHLKGALIADARVAGLRPKPADVERQAAGIMAGREVLENLRRLRAAGCAVEYFACDVRDAQALGGLIEDVYARLGRIDAVIHGAGVIEDKLIADKTQVSFDRVFGTKTDSAWILANHLRPDSLKWLAFFTSVAGRYGNRGQADYAAANEALNRYAWQLSRRWPDTRVMAINWGPWDAGMASDAVKDKFRTQGILPIPVRAGAQYFLQELAYGVKSEVELVVGAGPWEQYDGVEPQASGDVLLPLIRADLHIASGGTLVLDHHFSLQSDPYLADHSMDGKAVLPAAAAVEWMAQVAAAGWPGWQVAEVRDLKVLSGVVLHPQDGRKVQFRARAATHSQPGEQMVAVEIVDPERGQALYKASVRLVETLAEAPQLSASMLSGGAMDSDRAYREYLFHGPDFQLLDALEALDVSGADARLHRSSPQAWLQRAGQWLFDPGLLDCGPQLAILWSRAHLDKTALPSVFGSVHRYGREPMPDQLQMQMRIQGEGTDSSLNYDVLIADLQGRVRLELRDVVGTASAALNRLAGTGR